MFLELASAVVSIEYELFIATAFLLGITREEGEIIQ
jgi:hypothetical protein